MMTEVVLLATLAFSAEAPASPAAPSAPKTAEVKPSTPTATISSIYTVDRMRDPFMQGGMGGASGGAAKTFEASDFNIHNLVLKGVMKDGGVNLAMLYDQEYGVSFVLRGGKVYDSKRKPMANVKGSIDLKTKTVKLEGLEGDVQVLRLGEDVEAE
jgi:hypothetical protein